jgi:adenylate cyclase
VLTAIDEMAPRAIGLDYLFIRPQSPERDQQLLAALARIKAATVLGAVQNPAVFTAEQLAFQRSFVATSERPAGFLTLHYDPDKVIRIASSLAPEDWPTESFAALLAKMAGAQKVPPSFRVAWLRGADGEDTAFRMITARALLEAQAKRGPEWAAIAQGVRGRVILVGGAFQNMDQHQTPLSVITKAHERGVSIHAQLVAQLLDGRYFAEAGPLLLFGLLLSRSLVGFFAGIRSRSRVAISVAVVGGAVGLLLLDARLLDVSRIVIPITLLVLAWLLGFLAGRLSGRLS